MTTDKRLAALEANVDRLFAEIKGWEHSRRTDAILEAMVHEEWRLFRESLVRIYKGGNARDIARRTLEMVRFVPPDGKKRTKGKSGNSQ